MTKKRNGKWDEYNKGFVILYGKTLVVSKSGKLYAYVAELSFSNGLRGCTYCDLGCSIAGIINSLDINIRPCHEYSIILTDNWHFRNLKYSLILASHVRTLNLNI